MNSMCAETDYEGSYLLGEADGEIWTGQAHPNQAQGVCMLSPDEVGQRDVFGQEAAGWLRDQADAYTQQDASFDAYSYYEGFLASVRRTRSMRAFAVAGSRRR
jgi:hypothetical protein